MLFFINSSKAALCSVKAMSNSINSLALRTGSKYGFSLNWIGRLHCRAFALDGISDIILLMVELGVRIDIHASEASPKSPSPSDHTRDLLLARLDAHDHALAAQDVLFQVTKRVMAPGR
jgi:hypothetical protein